MAKLKGNNFLNGKTSYQGIVQSPSHRRAQPAKITEQKHSEVLGSIWGKNKQTKKSKNLKGSEEQQSTVSQ